MTSNEEWDVEKYKLEHECDEHWELRRNFLEAHKDRFPEEQLVCLAQVFTNVELLGCRYPKETMDLIAELSQDVAADYREKQKSKLQRTFVKASDAASSKIKGLEPGSRNTGRTGDGEKRRKMNFIASEDEACKKIKIDDSPFGKMILMQYPNDPPITIIQKAANAARANLEYKVEKEDENYTCEIFLNSVKLAEGSDISNKKARAAASLQGLSALEKTCYTVKVKKVERTIDCDKVKLMGGEEGPDATASDNVGSKMMKMMGWTGGGLGKTQQGIVEPVTLQRQMSRDGFGLKLNSTNTLVFTNKCRQILRNYIDDDTKTDLVFAPEFTNEERSVMHKVARELGLKGSSFGPKDKRTLVISRKLTPTDIVQELLAIGGSSEKYELVEPTGT